MTLLQSGITKSLAEDYTIDQSLRFNDGDSDYLSRTFSTGNRQTWTFSCWTKLGDIGANRTIFSGGTATSGAAGDKRFGLYINSSAEFTTDVYGVGTMNQTTSVYRDPSALYHVVWRFDTTIASPSSDRSRLYVNGEQISWSEAITFVQDTDYAININQSHAVGSLSNSVQYLYDGYLAEVYFIDGASLGPDSFGETDTTTNQWKPIDAVDDLTFGTNGFYQKYAGTELADSFFDSGNGGRHVVTANGNAHTDTSVKKIGTASLQVDGVGDYLSVPDSSDWDWGSGDFTLEAWVRPASYPTDNRAGIISQGTDNNNYWHFRLNDDGSTQFYGQISGSAHWSITSTTGIISTDTWYHVAVVKNGSNFELFIDGTSRGTNTDSTSFVDWSDDLVIGAVERAAVENYFDGYIDEVRISNVARYFSAFTAPTTAFTNDINTLLLLHCDGADDGTSFPDSASHPITAHGDTTNTRAQSKIGDSSIYLDETGDYFSLAASTDWVFGTGEWTLEGWFYNTSDSNNSSLTWSQRNDAGLSALDNTMQDWATPVSGDTTVNWQYQQPSVGHINLAHQSTFPKDSWHHVAHVRSGDTVTIYLDGVASTSTFDATGLSMGLNRVATIATQDSTRAYSFEGYMDEIRISDTARYTGAFTPSTTAFTADSNTMLLIHSDWDGGLGADSSGNENDFAATNLVATDQMVDSPTNNFSTLNPIQGENPDGDDKCIFSEGNLKVEGDGGWNNRAIGTIPIRTGKWYWEVDFTLSITSWNEGRFGICTDWSASDYGHYTNETGTFYYYAYDGKIWSDSAYTSYGATFTTGDIIGVALNMDDSEITFYKNGATQGTISLTGTVSTAYSVIPFVGIYDFSGEQSKATANFGQDSSFAGEKTAQGNQDSNSVGDFYYEPPSGFLALCASNLSAPEIKLPGDNFNTLLYDDGAGAKTGLGFQPDIVWVKARGDTESHRLTDSVRGVEKPLCPNNAGVELTEDQGLLAFGTDGFTVGTDDHYDNTDGSGMASWSWKAGGASTVTNNDGTTESEVSANTTAGFSIVSYTGTGSATTIGHGLSSAPTFVITKSRDAEDNWAVGILATGIDFTDRMLLNSDSAVDDNIAFWNDTAPTASVFTVGNHVDVNASGNDYIAYVFSPIEGYSRVGSYEGNNSADGTFVYTGFRPAWVMIKNVDSTPYWTTMDNKRVGYNVDNNQLYPNSYEVESTSDYMDIVSNGFKFRDSDDNVNSSATFIYLAFAESPFKYANAR